jgi:hypothetical protein
VALSLHVPHRINRVLSSGPDLHASRGFYDGAFLLAGFSRSRRNCLTLPLKEVRSDRGEGGFRLEQRRHNSSDNLD